MFIFIFSSLCFHNWIKLDWSNLPSFSVLREVSCHSQSDIVAVPQQGRQVCRVFFLITSSLSKIFTRLDRKKTDWLRSSYFSQNEDPKSASLNQRTASGVAFFLFLMLKVETLGQSTRWRVKNQDWGGGWPNPSQNTQLLPWSPSNEEVMDAARRWMATINHRSV